MKIYTCTGDSGQTSIVGGERLRKDAPRIEAYGTVDELNSFLGLLVSDSDITDLSKSLLLKIQNNLFNIGAFLAGVKAPGVSEKDVREIEQDIDRMDAELPPLRNFVLPGGCPLAAQANVARAVCRRAERRIVSITDTMPIPCVILTYINRLSDWLFVFARFANASENVSENFWQKPI